MLAFAVNYPPGKPDLAFPSSLVEVAFLNGFKSAWALIDHIGNGSYVFKIKTIAAHAIDADVADHQHPKLAFAFGLGAHQSREHPRIFFSSLNDGHR